MVLGGGAVSYGRGTPVKQVRDLQDLLRVTRDQASGLACTRDQNCHGARPVHLIIMMIKWIRTSRLSIQKSLSGGLLATQAPSLIRQERATPHSRQKGLAVKVNLRSEIGRFGRILKIGKRLAA